MVIVIIFVVGFAARRVERCSWSRSVLTVAQKSLTSRPTITSASAIAGGRALALVQRMARREVHAAALVDRRRLQRLRELDRAGVMPFGVRARRSATSTGFSARRASARLPRPRPTRPAAATGSVSFGNRSRRSLLLDRVLLQIAVEHEHDRRHRRRERDLVRAHGRFGEVRERPRACRPTSCSRAPSRRRPARRGTTRRAAANRGVAVVADDQVDRHAVAPGVVERHRGVLQADGAVRHHGERLALDALK